MEQKIDVVFPGHSFWIHLLIEDFYRVHLDKPARARRSLLWGSWMDWKSVFLVY